MPKTIIKDKFAHKWLGQHDVELPRPVHAVVQYGTAEHVFAADEITGHASAVYVISYDPKREAGTGSGSAGQIIFDGTVLGKKGSFTINSTGCVRDGVVVVRWEIVHESGRGELKDIAGRGSYRMVDPMAEIVEFELEVELP